ncbi:hypothetical protein L484_007057 [Morus notabilis]|uniref:Uncharacterized protein n=1 Tax=Morus notabilis TaxID=981085 RepID=W9RW12_9ROSA|nr:hypothetical protein L484_007057 [Morus notabilis]
MPNAKCQVPSAGSGALLLFTSFHNLPYNYTTRQYEIQWRRKRNILGLGFLDLLNGPNIYIKIAESSIPNFTDQPFYDDEILMHNFNPTDEGNVPLDDHSVHNEVTGERARGKRIAIWSTVSREVVIHRSTGACSTAINWTIELQQVEKGQGLSLGSVLDEARVGPEESPQARPKHVTRDSKKMTPITRNLHISD